MGSDCASCPVWYSSLIHQSCLILKIHNTGYSYICIFYQNLRDKSKQYPARIPSKTLAGSRWTYFFPRLKGQLLAEKIKIKTVWSALSTDISLRPRLIKCDTGFWMPSLNVGHASPLGIPNPLHYGKMCQNLRGYINSHKDLTRGILVLCISRCRGNLEFNKN